MCPVCYSHEYSITIRQPCFALSCSLWLSIVFLLLQLLPSARLVQGHVFHELLGDNNALLPLHLLLGCQELQLVMGQAATAPVCHAEPAWPPEDLLTMLCK